jgi:hypothetical protein
VWIGAQYLLAYCLGAVYLPGVFEALRLFDLL